MELLYLLICLGFVLWIPYCHTHQFSEGFPKHANLYFIIDVDKDFADILPTILSQLFDSISLLEYRIAAYTTNGVFKRIVDFQSRECLIADIIRNANRKRIRSRKKILQNVLSGSRLFGDEKNVYIAITDDDLVSREFHYVIRIPDDMEGNVIRHKLLQTFHFYKDDTMTCNMALPKKIFFDECKRECDCQHGRLTNCYRVRRQFSKLTLNQRKFYIKAYKTLFRHPAFQHRMRYLLSIHPSMDFRILHGKDQIFPFHRKYLLVIENLFRLLDCRITIPYWHFPLHYKHLFQTSKNYHIWDDEGGFGSTKTSIKNGFCVSRGEFAYPGWKLPAEVSRFMTDRDLVTWICHNKYGYNAWLEKSCELLLIRTINRECLSRAVNSDNNFKLVTYKKAKDVITKSTPSKLKKFMNTFISDVHAPVHDKLGGIVCTGLSSYAPEFLPYHSMIDALWDYWQSRGKEFREKFLHDNTTKLLWFKERRNKYVDNRNLGECGVRVKYTPIF